VTPTAPQLRAARAWLGWSRAETAHRAGLNVQTIASAERSRASLRPVTLYALRAAYECAGVRFLGDDAIGRGG
jgi:transcriptional regulator with XRE-family HTH domain